MMNDRQFARGLIQSNAKPIRITSGNSSQLDRCITGLPWVGTAGVPLAVNALAAAERNAPGPKRQREGGGQPISGRAPKGGK